MGGTFHVPLSSGAGARLGAGARPPGPRRVSEGGAPLSDADALSQLGAALAELREARGLSQEEVAERIERYAKRHQQLRELRSGTELDAIERGCKDPSFLMLVHIARAIDVPLPEVLVRWGDLLAGT